VRSTLRLVSRIAAARKGPRIFKLKGRYGIYSLPHFGHQASRPGHDRLLRAVCLHRTLAQNQVANAREGMAAESGGGAASARRPVRVYSLCLLYQGMPELLVERHPVSPMPTFVLCLKECAMTRPLHALVGDDKLAAWLARQISQQARQDARASSSLNLARTWRAKPARGPERELHQLNPFRARSQQCY
jgi:hypothetical protein